MKNILLILLLIFASQVIFADSLDVTGYKQIPNDISATRYSRPDANDNQCALIKVLTALENLGFESNLGIVGDIEKKQGEYWIYVSPGERRLSFWGSGYMRYNYNLPEPAQSGKVYQMIVVPKGVSDGGIATGYVLLKSEPTGAKVWIDNEYMGVTPYQSEMTAGYHDYRLEKEMYYPKEGGFTIRLNETTSEEATLDPNFGGLTITSTPISGAAITLDGKLTEFVTPHTFEMLSSGGHSVALSIDLYEPESRQVSIRDNETVNLEIPLTPVFGNISITTDPAAGIFIDEQQVATGTYNDILKKGVHTIEARLDKYYPQSRKLDMKAGASKSINFKLKPITGNLSVETTPPEAEIIINGTSYGTSPRIIPDLIIGTYEIELRRENHATVKKSFEIKENERTTINENLDNFTEVTIQSSPSGASLTLNGKSEGTTPQKLTTNFGKNMIKLTKSGYNDLQETFTVTEKQNSYSFTLVSDQKAMAQLDFTKYKKRKNWWLTGTLVTAGTGAYFMYSADKAGKNYETATTDATSLYDQMEQHYTISYAAIGVSGFCAIMTIINASKQGRAKKRMSVAAVPVEGGGVLSVRVDF
jgi:hypothetical protein